MDIKKRKGVKMNEIFETIKKIAVKIGEEIKYADLGYTDHAKKRIC